MRPFTQFLADVGAPVERGFQQVGLPLAALDDVNNYVPSHRFLSFVVNMARHEGIEDLGFRVGYRYGANSADPKLASLLSQSPTLYSGIVIASELVNKTVSRSHMGLLQSPASNHAYFFHYPSCGANDQAYTQIGWYGFMTLLGIVRVFTGQEWHPTEIGLMTHKMPCRSIRESFPDTRFRLSQPHTYIRLENALLCLPPRGQQATTPASTPPDYAALPTDFAGSLRQILVSCIQECASISHAAKLCSTSTRNLQRKLTEAGTRYSEVLDQARFQIACRMLQDPNVSVAEISRLLAYSDPTHFSRAFRRISGVCPRTYRDTHVH